jgi:hypothetical protein
MDSSISPVNNIEITIDQNHRYKINDGSKLELISVTTLIKKWFSKFDEDEVIYRIMSSSKEDSEYFNMSKKQILDKWKKMRDNGTLLHSKIEHYLLHKDIQLSDIPSSIEVEFQYFMNFLSKHSNLTFVASEKMIISADKKVAGTIDCLMKDELGNYYLIDWKCSKQIKCYSSDKGFGPLSQFNDCNYDHYTLQLNIYRYILETNYNIKIKSLWLINLHRNNSNYHRYSIQKYDIAKLWEELTV